MRRYIFNGDIGQLEKQYHDVIIVGSGVAGLYTALNLDEKLNCVVLSKAAIEKSSSWLAQGGIAAVISENDNVESHFNDTIVAGAGLCEEDAVKVLVNEGPDDIRQLMALNVPFDLDEQGLLHITREGGHTHNRVLHCGGDATGRETVKTLASIAGNRSNITLGENVFLLDILTEGQKVCGVIISENGKHKLLVSAHVVISTGGIGQVYAYTTNPLGATGDGIAAAMRAGAHVKNMEFIQFHPTALYTSDKRGQAFLISEAVRGEGGVLKNIHGRAFMEGKHPMKDLAPRDIVTRVIAEEMDKTHSRHVFLDITAKSAEYLSKRFPTIFKECHKQGIDISEEWIPVRPVQHYLMGGLETDLKGMTNIEGLYASGESSCTGVHGANRLASNSLLECLVFGRRCAQCINKSEAEKPLQIEYIRDREYEKKDLDYDQIKKKIKQIMTFKGGIIRDQVHLEEALKEIENLLCLLEKDYLDCKEGVQVLNMTTIAEQILKAALKRKESIGAHFRIDLE